MMNRISTETLDKANYPEMVDMIHQLLSNAGDYTFIFVGNIDETTFKPLMEQYLATLPAAAPRKAKVITEIKDPERRRDQRLQAAYGHTFNLGI